MKVWLSLIVCLIGFAVFCISKDGKAQTLGLHCFWVGLLAFLLVWGGHVALAIQP